MKKLKDFLKMSKKDKIQEEALISEQENIQNTKNQEVKEEIKIEEPSVEELLQVEKDKFLRPFAEFENYKKRTTKERIDLFKTAGREVITALLPVIDDFDRALPEIKK